MRFTFLDILTHGQVYHNLNTQRVLGHLFPECQRAPISGVSSERFTKSVNDLRYPTLDLIVFTQQLRVFLCQLDEIDLSITFKGDLSTDQASVGAGVRNYLIGASIHEHGEIFLVFVRKVVRLQAT